MHKELRRVVEIESALQASFLIGASHLVLIGAPAYTSNQVLEETCHHPCLNLPTPLQSSP